MHKFAYALIGLAVIAGTSSLFAQDKRDNARNLIERRIEIQQFDKDGDGKLNDEERAAARAAFRPGPARTSLASDSTADAQKRRLIEGDKRRKLLQWYDKDGDGKLNEAEQQTAQAEFLLLLASVSEPEIHPRREQPSNLNSEQGGRAEQARQQFLAVFDKDRDGKLSESEQAAMRDDFEKKRSAARAHYMKDFDKNGDGVIDNSEREALSAVLVKRRDEMQKKYDQDGDGRLNDEERQALFNGLRKQRGELTRKYDKNGNGYLEFDEEEKARADGAIEEFGSPVFGNPGISRPAVRPARPRTPNDRRPPRPTGN